MIGARPLLAVLGSTGSGKSDLGLELAHAFNGEIVNCDSVQIYRHLDIGTAKLPIASRRGIPHHLIDIVDPDQHFTAGDYVRIARPLLAEIASRDRLPILVGGTGFYYRALIYGLFEGPERNATLRDRLTKWRPAHLHRFLKRLDAQAAARIHPNDVQKAIRAVEVCIAARRPMSDLLSYNRQPLEGFHVLALCLDPPRETLRSRIDLRCERMFHSGLIDETRRVLSMGFKPDAKALQSIGYREAIQCIAGEITLEEAIERTQIATRQYAKRQMTWFRREANIEWLPGLGDQVETFEPAKGLVESHFKKL